MSCQPEAENPLAWRAHLQASSKKLTQKKGAQKAQSRTKRCAHLQISATHTQKQVCRLVSAALNQKKAVTCPPPATCCFTRLPRKKKLPCRLTPARLARPASAPLAKRAFQMRWICFLCGRLLRWFLLPSSLGTRKTSTPRTPTVCLLLFLLLSHTRKGVQGGKKIKRKRGKTKVSLLSW